MTDGTIAGNGNSRYLKTIAQALTLYPTYQDFMSAMIAGTFPIDLNGINTAGWSRQGTPLNKANLLSDSTASALGLSSSATPNSALNSIASKIKTIQNDLSDLSEGTFVTGTYTGDNAATRTINLGFKPKAVLVLYMGTIIMIESSSNTNSYYGGFALEDEPAQGYSGQTQGTIVEIVSNGFNVFYQTIDQNNYRLNIWSNLNLTNPFLYIAFK